jgi:cyclic pyranopterin monophosphate synthase
VPDGNDLTHIDAAGRARMVDVTSKPWTRRKAIARCRVVLGPPAPPPRDGAGVAATDEVRRPTRWVEVFDAARVAGVQAAKQTSRLIPLCHSLTGCDVRITVSLAGDAVNVESEAEVVGPTGVEMEALTGCTLSALTVVSALSHEFPDAFVDDLTLWEKSGGRSGTWARA